MHACSSPKASPEKPLKKDPAPFIARLMPKVETFPADKKIKGGGKYVR
jgi:hypothetical protein